MTVVVLFRRSFNGGEELILWLIRGRFEKAFVLVYKKLCKRFVILIEFCPLSFIIGLRAPHFKLFEK